jgi:hypothetical protein
VSKNVIIKKDNRPQATIIGMDAKKAINKLEGSFIFIQP